MTRLFGVALVVWSLCLCGAGVAGERSDPQAVRQLMQVSGLNKQIEQFPAALGAELDREQAERPTLTDDQVARIRSVMAVSFDAKQILASVQKSLERNLARGDLKAAVAWLESPLGRKITKLEEDSSTAEGYRDMQEVGPRLLAENANTGRFRKIQRLDSATGATEASLNMAQNVQMAIASAASSAAQGARRPSYDEILEIVNMSRDQMRSHVERMVQMGFLYAYRGLAESEIDKYIAFAESKPGRRYHQATVNAVNDAVVEAARKFGSQIGLKMENI